VTHTRYAAVIAPGRRELRRDITGHSAAVWAAAVWLAGLTLTATPAAAATRQAGFSVGATVIARAAITGASSPAYIEISASDIARGYVEVTRASHLTVVNSSPQGFALDVWPSAAIFQSVIVRGLGSQITLNRDGGSINVRGTHGAVQSLAIDLQFALAPDLTPGRYPWPLQYAVRPL